MLRVVLTNRKLSDGFFMLAGPLAHSHEQETFHHWDVP